MSEGYQIRKPMCSLKHACVSRIAVELWNCSDLESVVTDTTRTAVQNKRWSQLEASVVKKAKTLSLPGNCLKNIEQFVTETREGFEKWLRRNKNVSCDICTEPSSVAYLLRRIVWTGYGEVDFIKTAYKFISDTSLYITYRFRLACVFCVEYSVRELWKMMKPENFHEKRLSRIKTLEDKLVVYWSYEINSRAAELRDLFQNTGQPSDQDMSVYGYALRYCLYKWDIIPSEYFYQKCNAVERQVGLETGFELDYFSGDILQFYYTKLTADKRLELFKKEPIDFLSVFLKLPWLSMFMETFAEFKHLLKAKDFHNLLLKLANYPPDTLEYEESSRIFDVVWLEAPPKYRQYIFNENCMNVALFIAELWLNGHMSGAQLVISFAETEHRQKIFLNLVTRKKWDVLNGVKFHLVTSKENLDKLKDRCTFAYTRKLQEIFHFLEERFEVKRKTIGGDATNVKRQRI